MTFSQLLTRRRRSAFVLTPVLFVLSCSVRAQTVLRPETPEARSLGAGASQTYSLELHDGDFAPITLQQDGKLKLTVMRSGGTIVRRFPEPSEVADTHYAFTAEGSGSFVLSVTNPTTQASRYNLVLGKIVSPDTRLQTSAAWVDPNPSPRLEALKQKLLNSGGGTDSFWKQVTAEGTPMVEPFGTDGKYQLVTFLWRAEHDTRNVLVLGSFAVPNLPRNQYVMHHLADTDIWYWTVKLAAGARFSYRFSPNDSPRDDEREATLQSDPLNPHRVDCSPAQTNFACHSRADLPGAPLQPWLIEQANTPRGSIEIHTIHSAIQNIDRTVAIYTPPRHSSGAPPSDLLVLFDGDEYLSPIMKLPTTLDNLIAAGRIPPTVAVLVFNPGATRLKDLVANPAFADSIAREVLPWVWGHYNVTHKAAHIAVGGYSAGGLAANYEAFRYPAVFGNVISQSGAVWWSPEQGIYDRDPLYDSNWMARQFAAGPKLPITFYIEAGVFEIDLGGQGGDILEASRELRDVLEAKRNKVFFHLFVGGHDALTWPGTIADALMDLFGNDGSQVQR